MLAVTRQIPRVRSWVPGSTTARSCPPLEGCSCAHTSVASSQALLSQSPGVSLAYYKARRGFAAPDLLFCGLWVCFFNSSLFLILLLVDQSEGKVPSYFGRNWANPFSSRGRAEKHWLESTDLLSKESCSAKFSTKNCKRGTETASPSSEDAETQCPENARATETINTHSWCGAVILTILPHGGQCLLFHGNLCP